MDQKVDVLKNGGLEWCCELMFSKQKVSSIGSKKQVPLEPTKENQMESKEGYNFWKVGEKYIIRTVTMYQIGELVYFDEHDIVLKDAAWIAETARFYNCLKEGELSEVEPFVDDVLVNRRAIVDATKWRHTLPREQK